MTTKGQELRNSRRFKNHVPVCVRWQSKQKKLLVPSSLMLGGEGSLLGTCEKKFVGLDTSRVCVSIQGRRLDHTGIDAGRTIKQIDDEHEFDDHVLCIDLRSHDQGQPETSKQPLLELQCAELEQELSRTKEDLAEGANLNQGLHRKMEEMLLSFEVEKNARSALDLQHAEQVRSLETRLHASESAALLQSERYGHDIDQARQEAMEAQARFMRLESTSQQELSKTCSELLEQRKLNRLLQNQITEMSVALEEQRCREQQKDARHVELQERVVSLDAQLEAKSSGCEELKAAGDECASLRKLLVASKAQEIAMSKQCEELQAQVARLGSSLAMVQADAQDTIGMLRKQNEALCEQVAILAASEAEAKDAISKLREDREDAKAAAALQAPEAPAEAVTEEEEEADEEEEEEEWQLVDRPCMD